MRQFTDNAGRTWTLAITVDAIRRVQGLAKVNLANLMDGEPPLLTRLQTDLVLLADVLWAIVEPQARQVGVDDAAFGQALGGDAIAGANDALWEELADFFRLLRRTNVTAAIQKQAALVRAGIAATQARVEAIDPEATIAKALAPGMPSSSSPESPGSTPDP